MGISRASALPTGLTIRSARAVLAPGTAVTLDLLRFRDISADLRAPGFHAALRGADGPAFCLRIPGRGARALPPGAGLFRGAGGGAAGVHPTGRCGDLAHAFNARRSPWPPKDAAAGRWAHGVWRRRHGRVRQLLAAAGGGHHRRPKPER